MSRAVAVAGATGAVGREMLSILERRGFPLSRLHLLASERSAGKTLPFRGEELRVERLDGFDFSGADIALFSAGGETSRAYAPAAGEKGCVVVDNSSCFRYDADVPLVVPEVNGHALDGYAARNIVANPNCSTIQLVVALKPLHDAARIRRVSVATYQAVSGAGAAAMEELRARSGAVLAGEDEEGDSTPRVAFNAVPHIDAFQDNGYTREEMKVVWETRKILGDDSIRVSATAVRIPVFRGHSEAVGIETEKGLSPREAREILSAAPGVKVVDEPVAGGYPTPAIDADGNDEVFVGRIREDLSCPGGLLMWVVSDNLRKGAALNAVQIAERLLERL